MRRQIAVLPTSTIALSACGLAPNGGSGGDGPTTYALVRLRHDETRIQMVALMETFSDAGCDAAINQFMAEFTKTDDVGWRQTERRCTPILDDLYQRVMNKEQFHATYMILSPESSWDVESRIVLFGVPSSQAQEACQQVAREVGARQLSRLRTFRIRLRPRRLSKVSLRVPRRALL